MFLNKDNSVKRQVKISQSDGNYANAPSSDGLDHGPLQEQDRFGYSLGLIGDVDHDGIPDLCVGADGDDDGFSDNPESRAGPGAVYVLFMNRDGSVRQKQRSQTNSAILMPLPRSATAMPLGRVARALVTQTATACPI